MRVLKPKGFAFVSLPLWGSWRVRGRVRTRSCRKRVLSERCESQKLPQFIDLSHRRSLLISFQRRFPALKTAEPGNVEAGIFSSIYASYDGGRSAPKPHPSLSQPAAVLNPPSPQGRADKSKSFAPLKPSPLGKVARGCFSACRKRFSSERCG